MEVAPIRFGPWKEAYRCTVGDVELVVVASEGPRILSLKRAGGKDLMYVDYTNFRVGDWKLIGGHRFSIAPESDQSYLPDNDPCQVELDAAGIHIIAPLRADGLRLSLRIESGPQEMGFKLTHTLANYSNEPARVAPWAITTVKAEGRVLIPCASEQDQRPVVYWDNGSTYRAAPEHPQWKRSARSFQIRPLGEKGKAGIYSELGRMTLFSDEEVFQITTPEIPDSDDCPHQGCNLEVYICADWMEMETLGGVESLLPGESRSYVQHWLLRRCSEDWRLGMIEAGEQKIPKKTNRATANPAPRPEL